MESTNIIRRSVHLLLKHYLFYTSVPALLFFPASASALISLCIPSSRLIPRLSSQIGGLFDAGGLPSSRFTTLLNVKISQATASFLISLPFTLSFLLLAKACVIIHVIRTDPTRKQPFSGRLLDSLSTVWKRLFITYLTSIALIFAANAITFSFIFLAFNALDIIDLSSPGSSVLLSSIGAAFYSIVLVNTLITCNLAMIVSGMESCSGIVAILRACILIKGKAATALSLMLPVNICFAAIESLFYYRVVKAYKLSHAPSVVWEATLLIYMYSIVFLVDTIMVCIFYYNGKARYLSASKCGRDEGRMYLSVSASFL